MNKKELLKLKGSGDTMDDLGVVQRASRVNVRERPGKKATVIDVLNRGDVVTIQNNATTDWYKVVTETGKVGYMMSYFVVPIDELKAGYDGYDTGEVNMYEQHTDND